MIPVPKVTKLDLAFPARITWVPPLAEIPKEFHIESAPTKQMRFFDALFHASPHKHVRTDRMGLLPKEGVVASDAWNALQCVLGTFSIKHEHKAAGFAFLCSEWFADIRWETEDGKVTTFEDKEFDALWLEKAAKR